MNNAVVCYVQSSDPALGIDQHFAGLNGTMWEADHDTTPSQMQPFNSGLESPAISLWVDNNASLTTSIVESDIAAASAGGFYYCADYTQTWPQFGL